MKQFFGAFFGSFVGILIATILAVVITIGMITSGFKDALKDVEGNDLYTAKGNAILKMTFNGPVVDRERSKMEKTFGKIRGGESGMGLNLILNNLENAKSDTAIKGVYLNFGGLMAGRAAMQDIRKGIIDFKKSGKFVYAYSENYSQSEYYIASAADKVFLNPQGGMDWRGLSMGLMFFKGALEKLGIEMTIYRHGKFKSAIEPFILDKMSDANRLQAETFLNSIWNSMLVDIAASRKTSVDVLNKLANGLAINFPQDAVSYKLVDQLAYEDEVLSELKAKVKLKEKDKLNFVSHDSYTKYNPKGAYFGKEKIAVIYAVGSISSGEGSDDEIGSDRISKAIKDARLDENVKAIVLRVNSPGGSALASDVIWREVNLAKKAKPFIVSMGDLAASGGYYISCAADRIFAQPNTITGSIGVFGMVPNMKKVFEEKLGITLDTVNTNKHSDLMSTFRGATPTESVFIQKSVEAVYDVFIGRVAEGRKISKDQVDSIGQGRVWSGSDALKINLVDELGGLPEAIAYAAKKAKLKEYRTEELPLQKNPFDELFGKSEADAEACIMKKSLGPNYIYLKQVRSILNSKGVQVRLPYEIIIN
jgi:protease IV